MKKIQVPLLRQSKKACGPTSLAMVLKYFKKDIPLKEIIQNVGGIKSFGVRCIDLADYARELDFKADCYSYNEKLAKGKALIKKPSKELILKYLNRNLPVILAVRTCLLRDLEFTKEGHFIIITKYANGKFLYNDPSNGKGFSISENDLIFSWYNNILDSSAYMLVLEPLKSKIPPKKLHFP